MDTQLFEDLKDSLRQAKAIREGKLEGRRTMITPIDVKAVREQTQLSQGLTTLGDDATEPAEGNTDGGE